MILGGQLKSWFTKFRKYTVTYKKGFFQLANLANSPYTIIESFDKMPFCNHSKENKLLTSNTPFLKAQLYYTELEEGLWVFISDLDFKKNVEMTNIYDKSLPIDYNFINLHYHGTRFKSKSMLINGITLTNKTWSFFKAGYATNDCHFKEARENNITVYFSNKWLESQFHKSKGALKNSSVERFFKSANTYLLMPDTNPDSDNYYSNFLSIIKNNGDSSKNNEIKKLLFDFFTYFIQKYDNETIKDNHFILSDVDRIYIQKAENYLMDNLPEPFPGIEAIAKKVGISPTKLKTDFKVIHNKSIYQYYRGRQMELAHQLLSGKPDSVKEVAHLLGYENASKFAAAFKDHFGVQPSDVLNTSRLN